MKLEQAREVIQEQITQGLYPEEMFDHMTDLQLIRFAENRMQNKTEEALDEIL